MSSQTLIKTHIEDIFRANKLAVLATEGNGQPHASLVAITPLDDFVHLLFATYRSTRKYNNLIHNGKVAVLLENRYINDQNRSEISVLTAFGYAKELGEDSYEMAKQIHLQRHPTLGTFLLSTDCAIFRVVVDAYQLVLGIDEVKWWNIKE
jgi:nitroimidazol reductase NimA-like FMN-containing flavoprotein (pyridoxamine 5'-phosphate oxidase superfamily)